MILVFERKRVIVRVKFTGLKVGYLFFILMSQNKKSL